MTELLDREATTATGPTLVSTVRAVRGPVLLGVLLVLVLAVAAVLTRSGPDGRLEPDSYAPSGARALVELLRERGVTVERVDTVDAALLGTPRTTLLIPAPTSLTPRELRRLTARPGELVVVEARQEQADALGAAVVVGAPVPVERRRAACDLAAARTAGDVRLGGATYRASRGEAVGCYASGGRATLLRLPDARLTLLGSGAPLTNKRLDEQGAAALAVGLLGAGDEVRWLVPAPGRVVEDGGRTPVSELLPDWVGPGALQLLVAAAALALWRARRLGRVVPEPLPVVVRSAEAVEGRARLYRAAGARDRAARALREAVSTRLVRRLGLPAAAARAELVAALAARTGQDPARLDALLHGPAPADDAALVRLADDLDALRRAAEGGSTS